MDHPIQGHAVLAALAKFSFLDFAAKSLLPVLTRGASRLRLAHHPGLLRARYRAVLLRFGTRSGGGLL